jgi:hypothetical protein
MSTYRTAQGKAIDINALILKNGSTRAVGNMNINAKGDVVDGNNRPIKKRQDRIKRQYANQVQPTPNRGNVRQEEVQVQAAPKQPERRKTTAPKKAKVEARPEVSESVLETPTPAPAPAAAKATASRTGLGAAIARARQIRNDGGDASKPSGGGITKI